MVSIEVLTIAVKHCAGMINGVDTILAAD